MKKNTEEYITNRENYETILNMNENLNVIDHNVAKGLRHSEIVHILDSKNNYTFSSIQREFLKRQNRKNELD